MKKIHFYLVGHIFTLKNKSDIFSSVKGDTILSDGVAFFCAKNLGALRGRQQKALPPQRG